MYPKKIAPNDKAKTKVIDIPIIPYNGPKITMPTIIMQSVIIFSISTDLLFSNPNSLELNNNVSVYGITARLIILIASMTSMYCGNNIGIIWGNTVTPKKTIPIEAKIVIFLICKF